MRRIQSESIREPVLAAMKSRCPDNSQLRDMIVHPINIRKGSTRRLVAQCIRNNTSYDTGPVTITGGAFTGDQRSRAIVTEAVRFNPEK